LGAALSGPADHSGMQQDCNGIGAQRSIRAAHRHMKRAGPFDPANGSVSLPGIRLKLTSP
jgi:hypothetical protein